MTTTFISALDYCLQGVIALLIFVYPWLLSPGQAVRAFGLPWMCILAWSFWRMFYFDRVMRNDVPGMGYLFAALLYSLIALLCFAIRCGIRRWRAKSQSPGDS